MFSLMMGFWHYLFDKTNVQILIVGLDHAGKTVRDYETTTVSCLETCVHTLFVSPG
jgi:hypothetical protein